VKGEKGGSEGGKEGDRGIEAEGLGERGECKLTKSQKRGESSFAL